MAGYEEQSPILTMMEEWMESVGDLINKRFEVLKKNLIASIESGLGPDIKEKETEQRLENITTVTQNVDEEPTCKAVWYLSEMISYARDPMKETEQEAIQRKVEPQGLKIDFVDCKIWMEQGEIFKQDVTKQMFTLVVGQKDLTKEQDKIKVGLIQKIPAFWKKQEEELSVWTKLIYRFGSGRSARKKKKKIF